MCFDLRHIALYCTPELHTTFVLSTNVGFVHVDESIFYSPDFFRYKFSVGILSVTVIFCICYIVILYYLIEFKVEHLW